ncbi:unnamed protein product, partial [Musa acuminata subsp. burmannicoides]
MLMIHITLIIMSLFNTHRCLVPDLEKASHSCTLSPTFAPGHGLVLLIPGARVLRMVFLENGASCSRFHIFSMGNRVPCLDFQLDDDDDCDGGGGGFCPFKV